MKRTSTATVLILLVIVTGCSQTQPVSARDEANSGASDQESNMTTTQATQLLYRDGSKFCEITGDGEVWIDGDQQGSIETNGEIWVDGDQAGSIEENGDVWKAGNHIGSVTQKLEVWQDGNQIGEIAADGTIWHDGSSVGSTRHGDPRRAAVIFFFDFFQQ